MAASRMCQGVTKSGSPTPREMTSFMLWTMSKKSRMPERGMAATACEMKCLRLEIHLFSVAAVCDRRIIFFPAKSISANIMRRS